MILGNAVKFNGQGLVGFIDILGFSKEIKDKWNNNEDNPLVKLLELKKTLQIRPIPDIIKQDQVSRKTQYVCRVQSISDCIIVSFGFNPNDSNGHIIIGLIAFFDAIAAIWRKTLEVGFTVRGAVDYGDIFWDENEIIGPSFINVYDLEKKYAKTSRIILSSLFNQNLTKIFAQTTTLWNSEILKLLSKDIDGYLIFNPHNLYSGEDDKKHIITLLLKLREMAVGFEKEKYTPILAALSDKNRILKKEELGLY